MFVACGVYVYIYIYVCVCIYECYAQFCTVVMCVVPCCKATVGMEGAVTSVKVVSENVGYMRHFGVEVFFFNF